MHVYERLIRHLRAEMDKLERAIACLEAVERPRSVPHPRQERRGRKFMSYEERLEVSKRMKKYWASRRALKHQ